MKKVFLGLGLFIVLNVSTAYLFLFTKFGNGLVASFIEKKVNEKGIVNFKLEELELTFDTLKMKATIDSASIVQISGAFSIFTWEFNLEYLVDITNLGALEKFINQKLNGTFLTNGVVKGKKELMQIHGVANNFGSTSQYSIILDDLKPTTIDFKAKNVDIEKVLHTLNQPAYAKGNVDIQGNITSIELESLSGKVVTTITKGELNSKVFNEHFDLKLSNNKKFGGQIDTLLQPMLLESTVDLKTSLGNIVAKSAKINLEDNSLDSDYDLTVSNLNNLYDFTQTKLLGNLKLNGMIKKGKDLEVIGTSNTLNGVVDFKLFNDDFNIKMNAIKLSELAKMFYYPTVFDATATAVLDYNLASEQGVLTANLIDGKLPKSEFTSLLNTLAHFDITKEVYKNVDFKSQINKKVIQSVVSAQSENTIIDVPSSMVDLEKEITDTALNLKIKKYDVKSLITGDIRNPIIKIDASKILENKVKEKIEKKINKVIQKKTQAKVSEDDEDMSKLIKRLKAVY